LGFLVGAVNGIRRARGEHACRRLAGRNGTARTGLRRRWNTAGPANAGAESGRDGRQTRRWPPGTHRLYPNRLSGACSASFDDFRSWRRL